MVHPSLPVHYCHSVGCACHLPPGIPLGYFKEFSEVMEKRPWQDFTGLKSQTYIVDLVGQARTISPNDLTNMLTWRKRERMAACNGHDPIRVIVAYAQDELMYSDEGDIVTAPSRTVYLN